MLGHLLFHAIGRTKIGQFFNGLALLSMVIALPIITVIAFSVFAWQEFALESRYSRQFGDSWRGQYEAEHGPLSAARLKSGMAVSGAAINAGLGVWIYRKLIPTLRRVNYAASPPRRRRRKHRSSR